jgi:hypothetical protein
VIPDAPGQEVDGRKGDRDALSGSTGSQQFPARRQLAVFSQIWQELS